jgi:hypothetical protein
MNKIYVAATIFLLARSFAAHAMELPMALNGSLESEYRVLQSSIQDLFEKIERKLAEPAWANNSTRTSTLTELADLRKKLERPDQADFSLTRIKTRLETIEKTLNFIEKLKQPDTAIRPLPRESLLALVTSNSGFSTFFSVLLLWRFFATSGPSMWAGLERMNSQFIQIPLIQGIQNQYTRIRHRLAYMRGYIDEKG